MIPLRVDIVRMRAAVITVLLIVANTLAFFYELTLSPKAGNKFIFTFGLTPSHVELLFTKHGASLGQTILPLFTSMFLHGGWMHLLGNMLFLWVFGGSVEEALGHFQYLIFYLICGIGSAMVHTALQLGLEDSHGGGQRSDFGDHGGVHRAVSEVAGDDADSGAVSFLYDSHSGVFDAGVLVLHPVL